MRRCPHFQGLQKKPEFFFGFFRRNVQDLEDLLLQTPLVDTNTAPADLVAIKDQVIGPGPDLLRLRFQERDIFLQGVK